MNMDKTVLIKTKQINDSLWRKFRVQIEDTYLKRLAPLIFDEMVELCSASTVPRVVRTVAG